MPISILPSRIRKPWKLSRLREAEKYQEEGQFAGGSMGPKMDAAMRFVRWGGKAAIITSLDKALDALEGKAGTRIVAN